MAHKKLKKCETNIYVSKDSQGRNQYVVLVRDKKNAWFPRKSFERKTDARMYRNELISRRDAGDLACPENLRNLTMLAYWNSWSEECRSKVSLGWRKSQDQMARDHVLPFLGDMKIINITSRHICGLMQTLVDKGLGSQTRLHIYNLLNRMFDDAIHHYEILKVTPVKRKFKPAVQQVERKYLKPDQSMQLLAHSRAHFLGPAIWLALLSGLRAEALHALRWESVDFVSEQILIRDAYKRKIKMIVSMPKGKTWEYVPMPPALRDYLKELKATRKHCPTDFVVPGLDGKMLSYEALYAGVKRLCREAGVPEVSPHGLRHSCTEFYMLYGDSNIEDIRRLLHHKTDACTIRYIHKTNDKLQLAAQKVGDAINERLNRKLKLA